MTKVITYGTYDLLHYGHVRLLQRAKALGDYLIVGVTADSFDMARGKINVQQSLIERIEAVRATGLADEIIVEEYEGQKIDDIRRYGVDIFTVGSDWRGHFDYLSEYCRVVYLDRTEGISSSELRSEERELRIGLVGESTILNKFWRESQYVNGVTVSGLCTEDDSRLSADVKRLPLVTRDLQQLISVSDALYVISAPRYHYAQLRQALSQGRHVLCESPVTVSVSQWHELQELARANGCVLMDAVKTAYSTAYYRLVLQAKSGIIGKVLSVDATCTSQADFQPDAAKLTGREWNSISAWGPNTLLPIFQILGTGYVQKTIATHRLAGGSDYDVFTKVSFVYPGAVASLKVGQGVKSEGELVVSGTKGYIYVPAPWWKTDYFEVRYENPGDNRRYFYQLDGEGIRYEIVTFAKTIQQRRPNPYVDEAVSEAIIQVMEDFHQLRDTILI